VRLSVDGHTEPAFTGVTAPPPMSLGPEHADAIAIGSVQRHGRPREHVEADIAARMHAEGVRDQAISLSRPGA